MQPIALNERAIECSSIEEFALRLRDTLRRYPFELEDICGFPSTFRELMTDYLRALFELLGIYDCVVPLVDDALASSGERGLLDLCSGSGGPVIRLRHLLEEKRKCLVPLRLTDKFVRPSRSGVPFASLDVHAVPPEFPGMRTLFTALHHFDTENARKLLGGAVDAERPLAAFEVTGRSPAHMLLVLCTPVFVLLLTPFIAPFSWQRIFWTYIIPVVPALALWDGIISNLRTYSLAELRSLCGEFPTYHWNVGEKASFPLPVSFIIGVPKH